MGFRRLDDAALAATVKDVASTVARDPGATLRPSGSAPDSAAAGAVAQLAAVPSELAEGALDYEVTLGQGGMGLVRLAVQRSVGRRVAVKSLRPEHKSSTATLTLLREAWITGTLEHPNIIPIYDVGLARGEGPLIVLKHVEGVSWREVLADAAAVQQRFGAVDLFEFNLDILMQVCRAVHFAHSRGVVHRDIKPGNVMIGSFGEVYLLDWGIAVSLHDDPSGRLPLASRAKGLAGTPCYMAPEMLAVEYRGLSERTDVYLLGAVLYEICHGRPPHVADDPMQLLMAIEVSKPEMDADLPIELRRIITRALERLPDDRFGSAEELRQELMVFMRHRGSSRLCAEAEMRLAELGALLAEREVPRDRSYKLFGESRFGFEEALRGWPDNAQARSSLRDLFEAMVDHELGTGNARTAASLLAELADPPPELSARVEKARADEERRIAELERLQQDLDPRIGRGVRRGVTVAMGALWTLTPLLANYVDPTKTPPAIAYSFPAGLFVLAVVLWIWKRDSLGKTAVNRRLLVAILIGFCAHMLHVLATQLGALPAHSELAMGMVTFGAIIAVVAQTVDRRFWPMVPVYWAGALAAAPLREAAAYILSGCNLFLTIYFFAIWRPTQPAA
jgi:eukaryotic-like serine/threonine-protein kinase